MDKQLAELLDAEAARINNRSFIQDDPVQFPRRFSSLGDIEIAAILSATIAWGNRKMICRNCDKMLRMMGDTPHDFVVDGAWREIDPDINIHRTFFGRNLRNYLATFEYIYKNYGSLIEFGLKQGIDKCEDPARELVRHLLSLMNDVVGATDSRCLPSSVDTTALKRINMAFRWLVRNDGIVDMGVWHQLSPSRLYIPLDVHVAQTARSLGILQRRSNDRKAVYELTDSLRALRPDDPVIYDYALFGIGMNL